MPHGEHAISRCLMVSMQSVIVHVQSAVEQCTWYRHICMSTHAHAYAHSCAHAHTYARHVCVQVPFRERVLPRLFTTHELRVLDGDEEHPTAIDQCNGAPPNSDRAAGSQWSNHAANSQQGQGSSSQQLTPPSPQGPPSTALTLPNSATSNTSTPAHMRYRPTQTGGNNNNSRQPGTFRTN